MRGKSYVLNPQKFNTPRHIAERYQTIYKLVRFLLFIKNIKVEVRGMEEIPKIPVLFLANHKSNVDGLLIYKIIYENNKLPLTTFVVKMELKDKVIGYLLDLIDTVFLDRHNPRKALVSLEVDAVNVLKNNRSLCIFPEGTRISGPSLGEFKSGACIPAYRAYTPIVPVAIYNSERQLFDFGLKRKGTRKKWRSKTIVVKFGSPIKFSSFINLNYQNCIAMVQNQVALLYQKLAAEATAPTAKTTSLNQEIWADFKGWWTRKK